MCQALKRTAAIAIPENFSFEDSSIPKGDRSLDDLQARYFVDIVQHDDNLTVEGAESLLRHAKEKLDEVSLH